MDKTISIRKWDAGGAGVSVRAHGLFVHAELFGQKSNGILLCQKGSTPIRLDFPDETRTGNVYDCLLAGISPKEYTYLFHEDGVPVMDMRAKACVGHRLFGMEHMAAGDSDILTGCLFVADDFNWQGDKRLKTPYEDSFYYGLHVRGFTKDASSRIKEAGTFAGMQKKIPYLKKLGVTGIVVQPIYEFSECMPLSGIGTMADAVEYAKKNPAMHLNYWGYMPGFYYAPKNAYAYSEDAVTELKTLVKALHKNGLEIILQFYFEPSMSAREIYQILTYWVSQYHIDGFELLGADLPVTELASAPFFEDIKLWFNWIPYEKIMQSKNDRLHSITIGHDRKKNRHKEMPPKRERVLAVHSREYRDTIRQFLKGDGNMVSPFLAMQRDNPADYARINFFATYQGFRLADMVSYDWKHNETNGEENRDGENDNFSWNCGIEGETRKRNVLALRMKQMKNALVMLFTAQGTPFLFMGDEYGKSSNGNNNPYCQDNPVTWQKWNLKKPEKELLAFTKQLITLRQKHRSLCQKGPLRLMDYISCGFPDLSYHGKEAWRPDMDFQTRHIGMMLCGKYCLQNGKEEDCLYIAYNMHWEEKEFALPKLEQGKKWKLILDTEGQGEDLPEKAASPILTQDAPEHETVSADCETGSETPVMSVALPGRSIRIYQSEKVPLKASRKKRSNTPRE